MIYDIANTTKPLVPENHRVMIDDIRGLVVAKTAHGYEYKDINDSDVAEFVNAHKTVPLQVYGSQYCMMVNAAEADMLRSEAQCRTDFSGSGLLSALGLGTCGGNRYTGYL